MNSVKGPVGTTIVYCYTVENTGDATFNIHSLTDSKLSTIDTDVSGALTPGQKMTTVDLGLTITRTLAESADHTVTWTAKTGGGDPAPILVRRAFPCHQIPMSR